MASSARIAALLAAALLAACIQDDGQRWNPLRQLVPSIDENAERELGWNFDTALQEGAPLIHDPVVTGFLADLGQSIVSQIEPQPFVYHFRVVEDPQLNAFAVPGGFVYFHSGTILAAGSIDELAGVMGHEIAHVKAHHYARMRREAAVPDLAAKIVGIGAAIAAKEPGLVLIAQGLNVSMQLKYSREAEAEADELGAIWMSRAGFEPAGIASFFQRLLDQKERDATQIPPYLYSHPAVEDRIEAVEIRAQGLRPLRRRDPNWNERLGEVQARLAMLIDQKRKTLPSYAPAADRAKTDPYLADAYVRANQGNVDAALLVLARAEAVEPNDPRVPYRIGELLQASGRADDAIPAFRRAVRLDSSSALVFYKLGEAYKATGERHRAVFAFEQAGLQANAEAGLRERARWEVEKLSFPVVVKAGFATAPPRNGALPPESRASFAAGARHMAWWAELGPHFVPYVERIRVRWRDPTGSVWKEEGPSLYRRPYVGSLLEADADLAAGRWTVETLLADDIVRTDATVVETAAEPGH